jgi:hypothetical protein
MLKAQWFGFAFNGENYPVIGLNSCDQVFYSNESGEQYRLNSKDWVNILRSELMSSTVSKEFTAFGDTVMRGTGKHEDDKAENGQVTLFDRIKNTLIATVAKKLESQ